MAISEKEWEVALREYAQVREEIGRLEEGDECACDPENFHRCSLCENTTGLDQRARALMNLWSDTWAMRLYTQHGWLIERMVNGHAQWLTCAWTFGWTDDSMNAIRFSRRYDAEQIASMMENDDIRITEHQWE